MDIVGPPTTVGGEGSSDGKRKRVRKMKTRKSKAGATGKMRRNTSLTTRQRVREIIARHTAKQENHILHIGDENDSTTNSLMREKEAANDMKASYESLRDRDHPEFRTSDDILMERRTGKHSGCENCRREGFQKAENCVAKAVIYNSHVSRCIHVPLGEDSMGLAVPSFSEEFGDYRM